MFMYLKHDYLVNWESVARLEAVIEAKICFMKYLFTVAEHKWTPHLLDFYLQRILKTCSLFSHFCSIFLMV